MEEIKKEDKSLTKGHKMILGALGVSTLLLAGGIGGLASQKQKVEVVPYPVVVTASPTASTSASPTLTPRTYLPSGRSAIKAVTPTARVK